ncbi:MAG TPA: hypothetical protein VFZ99_02605, partial [Terriglobales bacterium]
MSSPAQSKPGIGALILTVISFLGSIACMLGLIVAIPPYVAHPAEHKYISQMLIWGGMAMVCVVVFCIALMYLLR